jgi:putative peptide zinc metalloprotease protein
VLCSNCRRHVSRSDSACTVCGTPLPGRWAVLDLVLPNGRRIPLTAALTLGRGTDNLIRLDGDTVSRHHARIAVADGIPSIEDVGSSYGTFVDGEQITGPARLRDGSQISLGDVELRVETRRAEAESGKTVVFGAVSDASPQKPRMRAGTKLKRLEVQEGDLRFVLRGPDGRFVRMSADDAELVELIDGETSIASLLAVAGQRLGPEGPGRLASLLADLGDRGLLEGIDEAAAAPAKNGILQKLFRQRQWTVTWAGPLFDRLYSAGFWLLFTLPSLILFAVIAAAGAVAFVYLIVGGHVSPFVVASRVGLGGLIFLAGRFLVVIAHECAHGLTVSSFGRKVPRAGIKMVFIFPYAFVDTTEAWFEPARRRIAISAAGPVSDLTIGGGAALLTVATTGTLEDVFFQLALAAYTGAIFNLNPLLDRDGYHILVDVLREPGLRRRSREWLAQRLSGRKAEPDDAGVLLTYAITALVWSLATAAFTIAISQRYYSYMTALAPAWVVWTVLILFYVLMLLPIIGVFWKAFGARRSDRRAEIGDALA